MKEFTRKENLHTRKLGSSGIQKKHPHLVLATVTMLVTADCQEKDLMVFSLHFKVWLNIKGVWGSVGDFFVLYYPV